MKILYFNNCWFTNVGEAFIDLGGMELTKRIFAGAQMACISAMSNYYTASVKATWRDNVRDIKKHLSNIGGKREKAESNVGQMDHHLDADYVIVPGMVATQEFLNAKSRQMIDHLRSRGCKVIFLGMGGLDYEREEVYEFSKYLDQLKPELVVTRDIVTYENYKEAANCISGIDCAFWTSDVFNPKGFQHSSYDVVSFNRSEEPAMFSAWDTPVIRPWHMQYSYQKKNYRKDILISDTPYDYLTVYANANKVYTDLVHASIISLMYGVPVKYWYIDKRSYAFDAVNHLKTDADGFMSVSEEALRAQKENVLEEIKNKV